MFGTRLMRTGLVLMLGAATVVGCESAPKAFAPAEMNSQAYVSANAKKYWKVDGWGKANPTAAKRVAIIEFNVQYDTAKQGHRSNQSRLSIGGLTEDVLRASGVGKKSFDYDEQMLEQFPEQLYDEFVAVLGKAGFDVIAREQVTNNPIFAEIKGKETTKKAQHENYVKGTEALIYPAPGFRRMKPGFLGFDAIHNNKVIQSLAEDIDAQVTLEVLVVIGFENEKVTLRPGSKIVVRSDRRTERTLDGGTQEMFHKMATLQSTQGMTHGDAVAMKTGSELGKGKVMTVDNDAFKRQVLTMYPSYMSMAAELLK